MSSDTCINQNYLIKSQTSSEKKLSAIKICILAPMSNFISSHIPNDGHLVVIFVFSVSFFKMILEHDTLQLFLIPLF